MYQNNIVLCIHVDVFYTETYRISFKSDFFFFKNYLLAKVKYMQFSKIMCGSITTVMLKLSSML